MNLYLIKIKIKELIFTKIIKYKLLLLLKNIFINNSF